MRGLGHLECWGRLWGFSEVGKNFRVWTTE